MIIGLLHTNDVLATVPIKSQAGIPARYFTSYSEWRATRIGIHIWDGAAWRFAA